MVNIKSSVKKINGYMKGSSAWIIKVGKELAKVKSLATWKDYLEMFDQLPFGEKVGDKFIAIAGDKFIEKYVDIVPSAYNVLYDLLLSNKIKEKTGLDPELVWNEIGKEMMFGGEEYDFSISKMALNPTSTHQEIVDIFTLLKLASKKPDLTKGGAGGHTGELSGIIEDEKRKKEEKESQQKEKVKVKAKEKKAKSSTSTTSASESKTTASEMVSFMSMMVDGKHITDQTNLMRLMALRISIEKVVKEHPLGRFLVVTKDPLYVASELKKKAA